MTITASNGATDTSDGTTATTPKTRRSMPDSAELNPVSGRSHSKRNNQGLSSLDRILERSCQIHGTPDKLANHTNRDCWVFKQAGKINTENKDKGLHSDDDEEPRCPNTRGQKKLPPR